MQVAAKLRYARISPQKCRLMADAIRGKNVDDALKTLSFTPKKSARIVKKVLESAIDYLNVIDTDLEQQLDGLANFVLGGVRSHLEYDLIVQLGSNRTLLRYVRPL